MKSLYAGTCTVCGARFPAGTEIEYDRASRTARHTGCTPFVAPAGSWEINMGEGYGGVPYQVGEVIVNPRAARDATAPRYALVLHASKTYYRDDGLSFGVGDEAGYVYEAVVRAATEEESALLRAAEAKALARKTAKGAAQTLADMIRSQGVFVPHGTPLPDGDRLIDTTNIYGSGSVFIAASDGVWYLERRMMDGDDWSRNNVAGSYCGWYLAQVDLVDQLRTIAAALS